MTALDLHHASLQMGGPDSFGTPPSYHKTLSGDLGLIHRVHRGFAYLNFATDKTRGLTLGFPGFRNVETHSRYTDSGFHILGFPDWRRRGVLPFGFPHAETPKPIHAKPTHLQSVSGFWVPGFHDLRK
jgi:hypothetical protein